MALKQCFVRRDNPLDDRESVSKVAEVHEKGFPDFGDLEDFVDLSDLSDFVYSRLAEAVRSSLPTSDEIRPVLFRLCQRLRAVWTWRSNDKAMLRGVLAYWRSLAAKNGIALDLEEVVFEAEEIWPTVKREDVVFKAWAAIHAEGYRPPACAAWFDHPKLKQLISLCCELQKDTKGQPFYLTVADAATLLGTSAVQVGRWFRMLRSDSPKRRGRQVLRPVELHRFGERKPNRYLFVGAV